MITSGFCLFLVLGFGLVEVLENLVVGEEAISGGDDLVS
jgi:hypothetical protein